MCFLLLNKGVQLYDFQTLLIIEIVPRRAKKKESFLGFLSSS